MLSITKDILDKHLSLHMRSIRSDEMARRIRTHNMPLHIGLLQSIKTGSSDSTNKYRQ